MPHVSILLQDVELDESKHFSVVTPRTSESCVLVSQISFVMVRCYHYGNIASNISTNRTRFGDD